MSVSGPKPVYRSAPAAWIVVLGLFLVAVCAPASAVTVSGLYSVEVPIAGSAPRQLAEGYSKGLAKVFVRVAGTRDVLARPGVNGLLADAESLLLSYQVVRGEQGASRLRMSFGAVGVNRALASVDAPVWGANRPLTLAWVAVEDRGSRALVTSGAEDSASGTVAQWRSEFALAARDRGLPIALPSDQYRTDRELLSDIWGQFIGRIRTVSETTEHDVLALVRVSRSGGQWRAGWVFDGMSMGVGEESVTAPTPAALARAVIDRWADQYAERYAVAAGDVGDAPQVDIVLDGVSALADYGTISQVLEGLTPVVSAGAVRVRGEQLTMRVAFSGEIDQLREYIALDPRFVAIAGEPHSGMLSDTAPEPVAGAGAGAGASEPDTDAAAPGIFPYQVPAGGNNEEDARKVFESLYPVLYYRWQPGFVTGNDRGQ